MKCYELLDSPEKWCRHQYAFTEDGTATEGTDPKAVKFCIYGATQRCYPNKDERIEVEEKILKEVDNTPIDFNDDPETTYEDILALLKKLDV